MDAVENSNDQLAMAEALLEKYNFSGYITSGQDLIRMFQAFKNTFNVQSIDDVQKAISEDGYGWELMHALGDNN